LQGYKNFFCLHYLYYIFQVKLLYVHWEQNFQDRDKRASGTIIRHDASLSPHSVVNHLPLICIRMTYNDVLKALFYTYTRACASYCRREETQSLSNSTPDAYLCSPRVHQKILIFQYIITFISPCNLIFVEIYFLV